MATVASGFGRRREIKAIEFEVLPSSSVVLRFRPEKVEWVLGKVRIHGTVKNTGPDDYEWVEVVYTAWTAIATFWVANSGTWFPPTWRAVRREKLKGT